MAAHADEQGRGAGHPRHQGQALGHDPDRAARAVGGDGQSADLELFQAIAERAGAALGRVRLVLVGGGAAHCREALQGHGLGDELAVRAE